MKDNQTENEEAPGDPKPIKETDPAEAIRDARDH